MDASQNCDRTKNEDNINFLDEEKKQCSLYKDTENLMGMDTAHDDFADFGLSMNKDQTMNVSLNFVYEVIVEPQME